jgi:hypothetical protein
MRSDQETTHAISSVIVEVSPGEVDAAAELTLKARVSCSPPMDLQGQVLLIKDHDGAVIGSAELIRFDGGVNETGEIVLKAPAKVGTYGWSVVCPAWATDDLSYEEVAERFSITVKPHATRLVIWDVPSTIASGETFRFKVGISCTSGCPQQGREFTVFDEDRQPVAAGRMDGNVWPGPTALTFAEVEVVAPGRQGLHNWEVEVPASNIRVPTADVPLAHDGVSSTFAVRFVAPPDSVVRVRVTDKESRAPLEGATVVAFPYRAVTDEAGVAVLNVPRGQYRLQVSRSKYLAFGSSIEVTGETTANAELEPEKPFDIYDARY